MRKINLTKQVPITQEMATMQSIYKYCWIKSPTDKSNSFSFKIPQTLIIKEAGIDSWYFSNKKSKKLLKKDFIKKKKDKNLTVELILQIFARGLTSKKLKNDFPIALYIYNDWRQSQQIVSDYLTFSELSNIFLIFKGEILKNSTFRSRNGIIQKFIPPNHGKECRVFFSNYRRYGKSMDFFSVSFRNSKK